MRIMTSNIWGDYFGNPVNVREDLLLKIYKRYSPDILGVQEYNKGWYNGNLIDWMAPDYSVLGTELCNPDCKVGEDVFEKTNYVPLFFKKDLGVLAYGFEYYTDTPDKSKSITWAVLKENDKIFAVCNTHFWWMTGPEHDKIRNINANQLVNLMKYLHKKYDCPVFAFGDMNTTVLSEVFKIFQENGVKHLNDIAEKKCEVSSYHFDPVVTESGRYKGTKTTNDKTCSIDHIVALGDGFKVKEYKVIEDQEALDSTDHSPVYADIEF